MAASASPPHFTGGWADSTSSGGVVSSSNTNNNNSNDTSSSLALNMSGLNLMSNYHNSGNNGPPGLSGSTVSTSSIDDRAHPHDSSIDHSSSAAGSFKGSTPSSPINHQEIIGGGALSRPPGLLGSVGHGSSVASPILGSGTTNPGLHSKNSSTTSPMLTLTPNSSVDGNSDLYSRQASPFQVGSDTGGPAMPFLRNDGQRGDVHGDYGGGISSTFGGGGSFDLVDSNSNNNSSSASNDNDGLLGLDALRDRAYSSPGPMARSFESAPSLRGGLPPSSRGGGGGGGGGGSVAGADAGAPGQRRRGVSRNNSGRSAGSARPPLSGSVHNNSTNSPPSRELLVGGVSNAAGDMSLGGLVVPFPPGGRSGDPSPTRQTQAETSSIASFASASEFSSFGAIGRPEFSGNAREWEPSNRRRSIAGTETTNSNARSDYNTQYGNEQQGYEPSRRRSIGTESGREFYQQHQQQHSSQQRGGYGDHGQDHAMAQKFGVLPSMSSQMQQKQRMPPHHGHMQQQQPPYNPMMVPPAKHQRSYSQPGPRMATPPEHLGYEGGSVGRYPPSGHQHSMSNMDNNNNPGHYSRNEPPRYIGAPTHQGHHVRQHSGDSFRSNQSRRSTSMSHGSLSVNSYGESGAMQKRNSQPNLGSGYYGQQQQALPSMHPSMQRGMEKSDPYDNHRRHAYEDDLSLLGEHIEVPADHGIDDGYSQGYGSGGYGRNMRPQIAPPEAMAPHYSGYEGQQIHHLPTAGAALPAPKVVYNVKFKRTQRSFVLGPRIQRDLKVGTYVKVEADRGEDLGIVIGKVPAEKYNFPGRSNFRSQSMSGGVSDMLPSPTGLSPPGATDLKCIIRLATHDEVSLLAMKRDEEEELLSICRTKVRQRALPMNVVDAEYQFDRHKLTFFFEAEGRIDFRELVRDLFSMYKTRIWMQQLDKNNCSTAGGTSQPPPNAMMDYGTPIIAPASEFADYSGGLAGGNYES